MKKVMITFSYLVYYLNQHLFYRIEVELYTGTNSTFIFRSSSLLPPLGTCAMKDFHDDYIAFS